MQRLLLVEDHASFRQTLALVFDAEPDFEVVAQAGTVAEARKVMGDREADLAVVDLSLPDGEGVELIEDLREATPTSRRWSSPRAWTGRSTPGPSRPGRRASCTSRSTWMRSWTQPGASARGRPSCPPKSWSSSCA